MARNGLAHSFAPELDGPEDFARTYQDLNRALRLNSYLQIVSDVRPAPAPVIDQPPPCPGEAWSLAIANLTYAGALLAQALRLTVREAPNLCRGAFVRACRPGTRLGVFGWAYALILTAMLVWR
jgi:hypothetical protein